MKQVLASFILLAASSWLSASTPVIPNTTLAQETGNNTSAVASFPSQSNGNLGANNISKAPLKSLLYPGYSGKLYVHFMPWFGGTNHMNVGYESNNATQVANQVTDMMSRGVDGAIVDWYGPNSARADGTTKLLRAEAEKRNGQFQFAVMEDVGALKSCAGTGGCDITGQMISDLTYAYNTYESSSAYIRNNGRPVVFFFGVEAYSIDWNRVVASVPGNPLFIQRNSGAFSNSVNSGAFAWPAPNSNAADPGDGYLDNFYSTGIAHPADLAYSTGYKGFNDRLALWTANRVINQNCGQTFLNSFAQIARYYSVNKQLFAVQLATWNDYEEGTELESGIDNCVSIKAAAAASSVTWSITGSATTVAYYTVYVSTDGTNLMTVGNVPATQSSYDFSGYALASGNYTVYVKAVGAPFMLNHMSAPVSLTISGSTPTNQPPGAKLSISGSTGVAPATVSASTAGSFDPDGSIARTTIDFGDGTIVSSITASHVYTAAGSYMVTATVTDNLGATGKATASYLVTAITPPPPPASSGITILAPTPNATTVSPVPVVASAKAANPITAMRIYVDSVSQYVVNASSINTHIPLSLGAHNLVVQAWDSKGLVYKSSVTITVTAPTPPPPPVSTGVTVVAPTPNSTTGSLVPFVASARAATPITAMRIYVDHVSQYLGSAATINTTLSLAPGVHGITVQAWDSKGVVYKTSMNITVK